MKTLDQVKPVRNDLSETNHTPGPWHHAAGSIGSNAGGLVAMLPAKAGHAGTPRNMADATLIVSAPELLAALQGLLDCPDLNLENLEAGTLAAMEIAAQAIAKAKGEIYSPVF